MKKLQIKTKILASITFLSFLTIPQGWVMPTLNHFVLLTLIGISWYMRPQLSLYYGILTFLLSIWMVLYTYSKKLAFANIIATIFFTLYLISIKNKNKSKKNKSNILKSINNASLLLIPLVLWLSFASYLGYQSI